jgi:sulfatase modifying factor 1
MSYFRLFHGLTAVAAALTFSACAPKMARTVSPKGTFTERANGVSFTMVAVPGGTFTMGCVEESGDCYEWEMPDHSVTVSDFHLGETEVTQALWKAVMGTEPRVFSGCTECPVELVGWEEAQAFIQQLNRLTGRTYRLPTEAEWEYAARGGRNGKNQLYCGSNDLDEVGWHVGNVGMGTHPVKGKKQNGLGLFDMSGNVWEWCQDWYGDYTADSQVNPQGPSEGTLRVIRGGSWQYNAIDCRVTNRSTPDNRCYLLGFRLAISAPLPK